MKKLLINLAASTIIATGINATANAAPKPVLINQTIAIVNNEAITQNQLSDATQQAEMALKQQGMKGLDIKSIRHQALQKLITEKIALQLAKANNLSISDAEVQTAIKQILTRNNLSKAELTSTLNSNGISLAEYTASIKKHLLISKLEQRAVASSIQVTPGEVASFLKNQHLQSQPDTKYHVAHILIPMPKAPTQANIAKAKALANKVVTEIKHGMNFQKAAIKYSQSGDALKGGDLGWESLEGLPSIFVKPVTHMQANQVVGPIKSSNGFHIIKLLGKKNPPPSKHFVTEYKVRQILIKTSPIMSDTKAKTLLKHLRYAIENGADFAKLAKANSQDADSAANNGNLGWVSLNTASPQLRAVISKLGVNKLSQPFQAGNTWQIVEVTATKKVDNTKQYQEQMAENAIFQRKAAQAVTTWQAQIRDESYIKVLKATKGTSKN